MAYEYNSGFGNEFETEAIKDALPKARNSPQKVNYNLVAEQISGSAFTQPRSHNLRSWLYRIKPSVTHNPFTPLSTQNTILGDWNDATSEITPNQLRWSPFKIAKDREVDFVNGIQTLCGAGLPATRSGLAIHIYTANISMKKKCMYNSDGDFLIVPQQGTLDIQTELGFLSVEPCEIVVIPRGVVFFGFFEGRESWVYS